MWKKSDNEVPERSAESAPAPRPGKSSPGGAVIGQSIVIDGDVTGSEDLTIHGRVKGSVRLPKHRLQVGPEGRLEATAHARSIVVDGRVQGDLTADQEIVVRRTGDVRGNLAASRIGLEEGAKFKGSIDMDPKSAAAAPQGAAGGKSQDSKPDGAAASENKATG